MDALKGFEILRALDREGVDYVVFEGVALNLHGLARATMGLDLFVSPSEENVARLRRALRSVFDDACIDEIVASDLAGDHPAVACVPPEGDLSIDIVARLGEAWRFEDLESMVIDWDGVPVRVVTPRQLYRMKRDTVRLQDRADAERIRHRFSLEED